MVSALHANWSMTSTPRPHAPVHNIVSIVATGRTYAISHGQLATKQHDGHFYLVEFSAFTAPSRLLSLHVLRDKLVACTDEHILLDINTYAPSSSSSSSPSSSPSSSSSSSSSDDAPAPHFLVLHSFAAPLSPGTIVANNDAIIVAGTSDIVQCSYEHVLDIAMSLSNNNNNNNNNSNNNNSTSTSSSSPTDDATHHDASSSSSSCSHSLLPFQPLPALPFTASSPPLLLFQQHLLLIWCSDSIWSYDTTTRVYSPIVCERNHDAIYHHKSLWPYLSYTPDLNGGKAWCLYKSYIAMLSHSQHMTLCLFHAASRLFFHVSLPRRDVTSLDSDGDVLLLHTDKGIMQLDVDLTLADRIVQVLSHAHPLHYAIEYPQVEYRVPLILQLLSHSPSLIFNVDSTHSCPLHVMLRTPPPTNIILRVAHVKGPYEEDDNKRVPLYYVMKRVEEEEEEQRRSMERNNKRLSKQSLPHNNDSKTHDSIPLFLAMLHSHPSSLFHPSLALSLQWFLYYIPFDTHILSRFIDGWIGKQLIQLKTGAEDASKSKRIALLPASDPISSLDLHLMPDNHGRIPLHVACLLHHKFNQHSLQLIQFLIKQPGKIKAQQAGNERHEEELAIENDAKLQFEARDYFHHLPLFYLLLDSSSTFITSYHPRSSYTSSTSLSCSDTHLHFSTSPTPAQLDCIRYYLLHSPSAPLALCDAEWNDTIPLLPSSAASSFPPPNLPSNIRLLPCLLSLCIHAQAHELTQFIIQCVIEQHQQKEQENSPALNNNIQLISSSSDAVNKHDQSPSKNEVGSSSPSASPSSVSNVSPQSSRHCIPELQMMMAEAIDSTDNTASSQAPFQMPLLHYAILTNNQALFQQLLPVVDLTVPDSRGRSVEQYQSNGWMNKEMTQNFTEEKNKRIQEKKDLIIQSISTSFFTSPPQSVEDAASQLLHLTFPLLVDFLQRLAPTHLSSCCTLLKSYLTLHPRVIKTPFHDGTCMTFPLHYALRSMLHSQLINILVHTSQAALKKADELGAFPAFYACVYNRQVEMIDGKLTVKPVDKQRLKTMRLILELYPDAIYLQNHIPAQSSPFPNKSSISVVHFAFRVGDMTLLSLLLSVSPRLFGNTSSSHWLHRSSSAGNHEVVQWMIDNWKNVDVWEEDENGYTPLDYVNPQTHAALADYLSQQQQLRPPLNSNWKSTIMKASRGRDAVRSSLSPTSPALPPSSLCKSPTRSSSHSHSHSHSNSNSVAPSLRSSATPALASMSTPHKEHPIRASTSTHDTVRSAPRDTLRSPAFSSSSPSPFSTPQSRAPPGLIASAAAASASVRSTRSVQSAGTRRAATPSNTHSAKLATYPSNSHTGQSSAQRNLSQLFYPLQTYSPSSKQESAPDAKDTQEIDKEKMHHDSKASTSQTEQPKERKPVTHSRPASASAKSPSLSRPASASASAKPPSLSRAPSSSQLPGPRALSRAPSTASNHNMMFAPFAPPPIGGSSGGGNYTRDRPASASASATRHAHSSARNDASASAQRTPITVLDPVKMEFVQVEHGHVDEKEKESSNRSKHGNSPKDRVSGKSSVDRMKSNVNDYQLDPESDFL